MLSKGHSNARSQMVGFILLDVNVKNSREGCKTGEVRRETADVSQPTPRRFHYTGFLGLQANLVWSK